MIRFLAFAFALAIATSAQAMSHCAAIKPDGMVTQAACRSSAGATSAPQARMVTGH